MVAISFYRSRDGIRTLSGLKVRPALILVSYY